MTRKTTWWNPSIWNKDKLTGQMNDLVKDFQEGLFLCLGDQPMDKDQLKGIYPKLPEELLAGQKTKLAHTGLMLHTEKEHIPASFIPEF